METTNDRSPSTPAVQAPTVNDFYGPAAAIGGAPARGVPAQLSQQAGKLLCERATPVCRAFTRHFLRNRLVKTGKPLAGFGVPSIVTKSRGCATRPDGVQIRTPLRSSNSVGSTIVELLFRRNSRYATHIACFRPKSPPFCNYLRRHTGGLANCPPRN